VRRAGTVGSKHGITVFEVEFARAASQSCSPENLRALRETVGRASRSDAGWEDRSAAHADFYCGLADATGVPAYSLLARYMRGSVQEMIARAGPAAGDGITGVHRRLIRCLEDRDSDGAAREIERWLARLGQWLDDPPEARA